MYLRKKPFWDNELKTFVKYQKCGCLIKRGQENLYVWLPYKQCKEHK